ncbi:hypothetical protein [Paenibacillus chitinolyticus]
MAKFERKPKVGGGEISEGKQLSPQPLINAEKPFRPGTVFSLPSGRR